jgi:hypothetical protein
MAELKKTEENGKFDCIPGILELIRQCIRVFSHVFVCHISYLTGIQLTGEFLDSGVINGYVPSYVDRVPTKSIVRGRNGSLQLGALH